MTVALYPGSFDPLHNGHLAVITTAAPLFAELVVGVGHNPAKPSGQFTPEERVEMIVESTKSLSNVRVELFSGLVTTAATNLGADCLLKGLRGAADLDVEMQQSHMNLTTGGIPTVFLPGLGPSALVASSYVRQIAAMGGDVSATVPPVVLERLERQVQMIFQGDRTEGERFEEPTGPPANGEVIEGGPQTAPGVFNNQGEPDAEQLLDEAIALVAETRAMPMSTTIKVNKDELLELLELTRSALPEDLHAARRLLQERDDFIMQARRDREDLIDQGRVEAGRMVERQEVVRAAEARAQRIVDDARDEARELRRQVEDYCDQKLASFEIVLEKTARTVQQGREKLLGTGPSVTNGAPPPSPRSSDSPESIHLP